MRYHHVAVFVSDMDESLKFYRDLLGFDVALDTMIPDGPGEGTLVDPALLDDIFKVQGSKARSVLLVSNESTDSLLELLQPIVPKVQRTPPEQRRYGNTGISELAFAVPDVDAWFEKVRTAGYETQTEYVWETAGMVKTFLFYDPDGNMIQLCEQLIPMEDALR